MSLLIFPFILLISGHFVNAEHSTSPRPVILSKERIRVSLTGFWCQTDDQIQRNVTLEALDLYAIDGLGELRKVEWKMTHLVRADDCLAYYSKVDLLVSDLGITVSGFAMNSTLNNTVTVLFGDRLLKGKHSSVMVGQDFLIRAIVKKRLVNVGAENGQCICVEKNCACCQEINLPHFNHDFCANISYNPLTIGLDLSIGVDGHYYTYELSARNPPPICLDVPYTEEVLSACVKFEEMDLTRQSLSGCVELEAELIHLRIVRQKLGCFRIPI